MVRWKSSLDLKQPVAFLKSSPEHCVYGLIQEKLNSSQQKVVIEDTMSTNSSSLNLTQKIQNTVTLESPLGRKKKIWKHSKSYLEVDSLITQSLKILDQGLTLKEKGFCSYWNNHSKVISKNLSLPTKIDYADSHSNSSLKSSNLMEGKSWFCMTMKQFLQNKNSSEILSPLQQFLAQDCTGYEVIHSKNKLETRIKKEIEGKKYKTIKVPVYPTENEKLKLLKEIAQFKWYYNACIDIYRMEETLHNRKLSKITLRDKLKSYYYREEKADNSNLIFCNFENRTDNVKDYPRPTWIEDEQGNYIECENTMERVIRGAIACFTGNVNSAISNKKNGNIKNFDFKYLSSKNENEYIIFDDGNYPVFHRNLKGVYSYRYNGNNSRHRTRIKWEDLVKTHHPNVGISIIYEKNINKWYGCIPVERTWFPPNDHRSENQRKVIGDKIIGLDPGMRKFITGISSDGESLIIGKDAYKNITSKLISIDKIESKLRKHRKGKVILEEEEIQINKKRKYNLWSRIKDLVRDMHWKTINYITSTYKYIFIEDIKVQSCIKGNIPSLVKRVLNQYNFHQFKMRLQYVGENKGCKVMYVHSALTSKICSNCGHKNNPEDKEEYKCENCKHQYDRDENAGKNIIIKGLTAIMQ